jgi:hypothetical protein
MLSERERRLLEALGRQVSVEDPRLARLLTGPERQPFWRVAGRRSITTPALLLALVLAVTAASLHLSSLGWLFLLWAAAGAAMRTAVSRGPHRPDHHPG